MSLKHVLLDFMSSHCDERPVLVALSGGPDSMTLFHLLIECKKKFQVAHVDHGWRPESEEEARHLSELSAAYGITYHLRRLSPKKSLANLEAEARTERLLFFRELCHKYKFQGVLLGHHADDQAETVLKRVFEGAGLLKLKGLAFKRSVEGVTLFRPFLKVFKKEILDWLKEREIPYFQDQTNEESRFLRARMRTELLPVLSQCFGKNISENLCRLAERAGELEEFLDFLLTPYRERVERKEEETSLNMGAPLPKTSFLLNAIIRDLFDQEQLALSSSLLSTIVQHLKKRSKGTSIRVGKSKVILDQGFIIIKKQFFAQMVNK